ncbi:unnamed protein product [Effrenium voratum]|uniref:Uncharacterized protein n=1 Tax=Effrenium voratum TaxID=2562239 RepID=A0AA36N0Z5_9DINO|nr:unnamed protein product [Effrenium voratum]
MKEASASLAFARAKLAAGASHAELAQCVAEAQASLRCSGEGFVYLLAAEASLAVGDSSQAAAAAKTGAFHFRTQGDELGQAAALRLLAVALLGKEAAVQAASLAAKISEGGSCAGLGVRLLAEALRRNGQLQQAAQAAEEAADRLAAAGSWHQAAEALVFASEAHLVRCKQRQDTAQRSSLDAWAARAHALAEQALGTARKAALDVRSLEARALLAKGAAGLQRDPKDALGDLKLAQDLFTDLSDRRNVAAALLARAEGLRGSDVSSALALVKQAEALFPKAKSLLPAKEPRDASIGTVGYANLEGLQDVPQWEEHIHFRFAGLQGRPVSNAVRQ